MCPTRNTDSYLVSEHHVLWDGPKGIATESAVAKHAVERNDHFC